MDFSSLPFVTELQPRAVAIAAVASLLVFLVPALRTRRRLLPISLAAMVLDHGGSVLAYLLVTGAVYLFAVMMRPAAGAPAAARGRRWLWFCGAMGVVIVAFIAAREFEVGTRSIRVLGVEWSFFRMDMWLLLRVITFLWEVGSGRVKAPDLATYLTWQGLPFLAIGPLLRYSQFDAQLPPRAAPERPTAAGPAAAASAPPANRVLSGPWVADVGRAVAMLAAGLCTYALGIYVVHFGRAGLLVSALFTGPWTFLLNSAGMFKLMECLARGWGITVPPSFNHPFGRVNVSEFWANWNMTATSVFRDFIFYNRWGRRTVNIYFNTMLLFVAVGAWHGFNAYWIVWGALHGIGFCVYLWWRQWRRRQPASAPRWQPLFRVASAVLTYVFICACWHVPIQIVRVMRRLL